MNSDDSELLKSWFRLFQDGAISEEDFNSKKNEILNKDLLNKQKSIINPVSFKKNIIYKREKDRTIPIAIGILIFFGLMIFGFQYFIKNNKDHSDNINAQENSIADFQKVLDILDTSENSKNIKIQNWLKQTIEQNNSSVLSKTCKSYIADIGGMDYDCDGCLSKNEVDEKWQYIYDKKFANFIHPFEDGQDSSDVFSVSNLEYLGSSFDQKYDIAFYYKCTIKDVGFGSSVNRIFKVINYKNNYYIDGIYNEF